MSMLPRARCLWYLISSYSLQREHTTTNYLRLVATRRAIDGNTILHELNTLITRTYKRRTYPPTFLLHFLRIIKPKEMFFKLKTNRELRLSCIHFFWNSMSICNHLHISCIAPKNLSYIRIQLYHSKGGRVNILSSIHAGKIDEKTS